MKKISDSLYVVVPGTYVDRRSDGWHVSNEESESLAGPFDSPEGARDHYEGEASEQGAAQVRTSPSTLGPPTVVTPPLPELVTLRQAAHRLPVTHQALYALRGRGNLPAPVRTEPSRSTRSGEIELYRFSELAALYEGKTKSERIGEGARRGWSKLTPEQRAERVAKTRTSKGQNR